MAVLRPFPSGLRGGFAGRFKPVGIPRIDWTHPLAFGLVSYWFDTGAGFCIDLVSGHLAVSQSNNNTTVLSSISAYGTGLPYNNAGATTQYQIGDNAAAAKQTWAFPYTYALGLVPLGASVGTNPIYWGLVDASGTVGFGVYADTTTTFGAAFNNSATPFSFTYTANTFYVVVAAATAATTQANYVNGLTQTAGVQTSAFTATAAHYGFNIGSGGFNAVGSADVNAFMFFGASWTGRALTRQDATLLYTDPYCFLLPPEGEMSALFIAAGVSAFSMTAATGNYTLTQEQEKLLKTSIDNVRSGSYALTVEQETLKAGRKLSVQEVPYALTGEQITELKASVDKLQTGTYTTTSQPVLKKTSLLNVQEVPYALTVETLTAKKGYADFPQVGNYTLTGENEVLKKTSVLNAQETAYSFTPENETLKKTSLLNIQETPYTLTVESITLSTVISFLMSLGAGTYSLTDEQLTLLKTSRDNLQSGTYSLTVEQQKLLKASLDQAQTGFYSLTGENETLKRGAATFTQAGSYSLTDEQLTLKAGRLDKPQSGSYALTDEQLTLLKASRENVQAGFYNLTGENVTLKRGAAAFTQAGFYSLTGENVSLRWKHLTLLFAGFYNLTDESLTLTFSGTNAFSISLGTGSYVLTDETVTLLKKSDLGIQMAVYALNAGWPSVGLQHRWPMDSADNASGVNADVVAGDSATEVGTVTSGAGPTGTTNAARSFDGVTGYAAIASSPLPSSGAFTVSLWAMTPQCNQGEAGGEDPCLLNFGTNSGGNQLRLGIDNGDVNVIGGLCWWAEPGDVNKGTTNALFSNNVWAHCGVTFDGASTYQTFFNGVVVATAAGGAKPPLAFDLFASDDGGAPFNNCSIAQVMVYNRVLSASEIAALYNNPTGIGEQVQEAVGHLIKAQPVFYAQTDENLALLRASVAKAQAGLYSTGAPLALLKRSRLSSTVGLYTLTGEALTFSTAFPGRFLLTATIRLTGTKATTTLLGLDDITKIIGEA